MYGKYYLTGEIKPNVDTEGNVAHTSRDVVFDWNSFEIPKGTANMNSFSIKVQGTESAAQSTNLDLFFAKSIDGVAPPSIGVANAGKSTIKAVAARPYIIGYQGIVASADEDAANTLTSYNVLQNGRGTDNVNRKDTPLILEGDPDGFPGDANYSETTPGFQTIWVAATCATSTPDFGTGCLVAGAHSADDLTIVVDGIDTDDLFAVGDEVVAFKSDGTEPKAIGKVTAVAPDLLTVDACPVDLPDDHEICHRHPVTLRFGFEY